MPFLGVENATGRYVRDLVADSSGDVPWDDIFSQVLNRSLPPWTRGGGDKEKEVERWAPQAGEKESQRERSIPEQLTIPAPLPEQPQIARSGWEEEQARKRRGSSRLFPRATPQAVVESTGERRERRLASKPVARSWPDPPHANERRVCAANYSAVEIHGFFGLIDDGSDAAGRMLIVHVPKWVRGYFLDMRQGDTLHVYSADGRTGGRLTVLATGRHRYYKPGSKVSTCTVCVPEDQWAPFA